MAYRRDEGRVSAPGTLRRARDDEVTRTRCVRVGHRAPAVVISGVAAVCDVWDGSIPGACAPPPSERVFGRPVGTPPVRGEAALARRETLAVIVVGIEEHDIQALWLLVWTGGTTLSYKLGAVSSCGPMSQS